MWFCVLHVHTFLEKLSSQSPSLSEVTACGWKQMFVLVLFEWSTVSVYCCALAFSLMWYFRIFAYQFTYRAAAASCLNYHMNIISKDYLKGRVAERAHSLKDHSGHFWALPKPEALNSIHVSHMGYRSLDNCPSSVAFPGVSAESCVL